METLGRRLRRRILRRKYHPSSEETFTAELIHLGTVVVVVQARGAERRGSLSFLCHYKTSFKHTWSWGGYESQGFQRQPLIAFQSRLQDGADEQVGKAISAIPGTCPCPELQDKAGACTVPRPRRGATNLDTGLPAASLGPHATQGRLGLLPGLGHQPLLSDLACPGALPPGASAAPPASTCLLKKPIKCKGTLGKKQKTSGFWKTTARQENIFVRLLLH